jgi:hypothetical protein
VTVLVEPLPSARAVIQPAVIFALRRHGDRPLGAAVRLGSWYAIDHRAYRDRVALR